MHRTALRSIGSCAGLLVILQLTPLTAHGQRVTSLFPSAVISSDVGCIYPRCFSSVPAVDGETAITTNIGTGVLVRSAPGLWSVQQVLWNPDGMPTVQYPNEMGAPAALQGDVVLLTGTSRKYNFTPVIYVWQREGTQWSHTQVLALPRPAGYRSSVASVALDAEVAAVCSHQNGAAPGQRRTQIDVFVRRSDGRFQRQAQLAPDISPEEYGRDCQVALRGTTLLVTDPMSDEGRGRVLVYQRGSSGWTLRHQLLAADGTANALFGLSAAISGNTIAIGAPRRPNFEQPLHLGAVYVFQQTATGWAQMHVLLKPEYPLGDEVYEESESEFGREVAVSGDRMAASWASIDGLKPLSFLYERRGVWTAVAGLTTDAGPYGGSPVLSGSIAFQSVSDGNSGSGSVAYELPSLWTLPPRIQDP